MGNKFKVNEGTQVVYRDKMYTEGQAIEPRQEDQEEADMWLRHGWVQEVSARYKK